MDAEEMQTLIESDQNWLTHTLKIGQDQGTCG